MIADDVADAAQFLLDGGIVLHATEGVWGFACDPKQQSALARLLELKARDQRKGMILIADRDEWFQSQLEGLPHAQEILASWPGPHTWVLPNHNIYSDLVTGGRSTVACRVPGHAQARDLCAAFGGPLISTSANVSGQEPVLEFEVGCHEFAEQVDCILRGAVLNPGQPSTIHGLDGEILRGS